jgi:hypothetical protein
MIPAVDFPHDFHKALRTSPAARTTCHVHAKALQHLTDELAIFAMADQDRQPLALVAMQKIQRPSMPNSQQHRRVPMPRPLLKVLLYVFGPQGAIEKAQPPTEQVHHTGHKPAAIPDLVAAGHYPCTVAVARVSAACKNCPTHVAARRAPSPVPSLWRRRANSCLMC